MLSYFLYNSLAVDPSETNPELADILRASLQNNRGLGVTGFLAFSNGVFAQYMEGPRGSVEELTARIAANPAHHHMICLASGTRGTRLFTGWDMGISRAALGLGRQELGRLLGSTDADVVLQTLCRCGRAAGLVGGAAPDPIETVPDVMGALHEAGMRSRHGQTPRGGHRLAG